MSAGCGLNSTSEVKQRALLVLPHDIKWAETLLHAHEQTMVTCGICSAAAKERMNHDNLTISPSSPSKFSPLSRFLWVLVLKQLIGNWSITWSEDLVGHIQVNGPMMAVVKVCSCKYFSTRLTGNKRHHHFFVCSDSQWLIQCDLCDEHTVSAPSQSEVWHLVSHSDQCGFF